MFQHAMVNHLLWSKSDHRAISLNLAQLPSRKTDFLRRPFCFEEYWTHHDSCRDIIEEAGHGDPRGQITPSLPISMMHLRLLSNGVPPLSKLYSIKLRRWRLVLLMPIASPLPFTFIRYMLWKMTWRDYWSKRKFIGSNALESAGSNGAIETQGGSTRKPPFGKNATQFIVSLKRMGCGQKMARRLIKLLLTIFNPFSPLPTHLNSHR